MAWQTLQFIIGMLPYPVGVYGGGSSSAATLWITTSSCLDSAATIEMDFLSETVRVTVVTTIKITVTRCPCSHSHHVTPPYKMSP